MAENLIEWLYNINKESSRQSALEDYANNYDTLTPAQRMAGLAKFNPDAFFQQISARQAADSSSSAIRDFAKSYGGEDAAPQPQSMMPQSSAAPQSNSALANLSSAVKGFEGFAPKAQWDYKQHSVGYGTKAKYPGEQIDQAEAERRFNQELGNAQQQVEAFAPDAPQGVKNALSSLTYNAGTKWQRSGLGQAIKAGDYGKAKDIFLQYNKAGGQTLPGLVNRRQKEAQWFDAAPTPALTQVASLDPAIGTQQPAMAAPVAPPSSALDLLAAAPPQAAPMQAPSPPAAAPVAPPPQLKTRQNKPPARIIEMLNSKNYEIQKRGLEFLKAWEVKQFENEDAPPQIQTIENPDGSKTTVRYDRATGEYIPIVLPGQEGMKKKVNISPGQKATDQAYGKEYAEFATGGFADAEKNLTQINGIAKRLANGEPLTGNYNQYIPIDSVQAFADPVAVDAKEQVEDVVQRNLRLILGSQFTQQEGERLIRKAYNPLLKPEQNAVRLQRLEKSMRQALDAKKEAAAYFEENNGSLQGFKGTSNFSISDFESALDNPNLDAKKDTKGAEAKGSRTTKTIGNKTYFTENGKDWFEE